MAVVEIKNPSTLKIKYDAGMVNGKTKIITKSYSNLKHNASLQDAFDIAEAIANLQDHTLSDVLKVDSTTLGA